MRKQRGYLLHDELRVPTPLGARVQIRRLDDTLEDYSFLGIDAKGRQILRHVEGRDVFHAFTVPFSSVHIDAPAKPEGTLDSAAPASQAAPAGHSKP